MEPFSPDHVERNSDLALVKEALDQDTVARETVAERLGCIPRFYRQLHFRRGPVQDWSLLEDQVQNVYLEVWSKLRSFRGDAKLETWARGFCSLELRRTTEGKRRSREAPGTEFEIEAVDPVPTKDLSVLVRAALDRLSPVAGHIIRLKHEEERSFSSIAEDRDLPLGTVKAIYYRGMIRLRKLLDCVREDLLD